MRKFAGFMLATLLVVAPALANAYMLTVKAGVGGTTAVTVGSTTKTMTGGTQYFYPTSTQAVAIAATGLNAKINGVAATSLNIPAGTTANQTVTTAFDGATKFNVGIAQTAGGTISMKLPNGTYTTSGATGVTNPTSLPLTIAAASNMKIVNYTINGAASTTGVTGAPGQVLSVNYVATGAETVTATFQAASTIAASIAAPATGFTNQSVTATVSASANGYTPTYAWSITEQPTGSALTTTGSGTNFTIVPAVAGTYKVQVVVSATGATDVTKDATVVVSNYAVQLSNQCTSCHSSSSAAIVAAFNAGTHMNNGRLADAVNTCSTCHTTQPHNVGTTCIGCHSVAQNAGAGFVQDNNGVRAITAEFEKWSHHVTGVALNDAHCAACHMEGTVVNGQIVADPTYHMAGTQTHLRDTTAGTDVDFAWDPSAPNHSGMDTFCLSCHDSDGAVSPMSAQIQALINDNGLNAAGKVASPKNPFGDTISNRYDKMQRPGVVDAKGQFNTANNSHHAVLGKKYTGRSRVAADARAIASPTTFANNSSAALYGKRSTIYDAGNFNALYVPLADAAGETNVPGTKNGRTGSLALGDDSTLHCGDCHTVGQWKVGSSKTMAGTATPVAIGAHGSNNEYLLRNTIGTDERHTQVAYTVTTGTNAIVITNPNGAYLVCFNCHAFNKYGSPFNATGNKGPHVGEYANGGRCNGPGNTIPFNGYTTGTATDGTQFASRFEGPLTKYSAAASYAGEQNPDFGNAFGMQCANCHNSGVENGYGGIHGSKINTYKDGMGNTQKMFRFLPGLGNTKYVPGTVGGFTGGTTLMGASGTTTYVYTTGGVAKDTNWEQQASAWNGTTAAYAGAGCYTLSENATAATAGQEGPSVTGENGPEVEAFGTWGGCDDHGAAQGGGDHGTYKRINRPVTY